MSDPSDFIAQIQQKEKEATATLTKAESENNRRVLAAKEQAGQLVIEIEEKTKETGQSRFKEAKEKAKEAYKKILIQEDNQRRDVIEGGKAHLDKAKKHVMTVFSDLFQG